MKDLFEAIIDPHTTFGDRLLALLIAILVLVATGLLMYTVVIAIDTVGVSPTTTTIVAIEAKEVVPSHLSFLLVGKIWISQNQPESYRLLFKISGETVSSTVNKQFFDSIVIGEKVEVVYGIRRLTRLPKPLKIQKLTAS
jgi:hypothetical protein